MDEKIHNSENIVMWHLIKLFIGPLVEVNTEVTTSLFLNDTATYWAIKYKANTNGLICVLDERGQMAETGLEWPKTQSKEILLLRQCFRILYTGKYDPSTVKRPIKKKIIHNKPN